MMRSEEMTDLYPDTYPEIEAYETGKLKVSSIHEIYYEQSGNKNGYPLIGIHGGPGSASFPWHRRYFDPAVYRIILYDQRGCGKSTPQEELKENTTWELIEDIEKLRKHLGIDNWIVYGGSWGATLGLLYAEMFAEHVRALIVYGIYTFRRKELMWLYQDGVNNLFPDVWENYLKPIPETERGDLLRTFYKQLSSNNEEVRTEATRAFQGFGPSVIQLSSSSSHNTKEERTNECGSASKHSSLIECHYAVNGGFLENDCEILDNAAKLQDIPGIIIQGRYDPLCPMDTAWLLHKVWSKAEFVIVQNAGHTRRDRGLSAALVAATDKFKKL